MSGPAELLRPYVPNLLRAWIEEEPERAWRTIDATTVFVDISGFTRLSERLSRTGRIGAEELSDAIDSRFADILEVAYSYGGSLLKFGGDALLLLFTGDQHVERGCRAAVGMRGALREIRDLQTSAGSVRLRMSVGVHTGESWFFLVGGSHRELIVTGPAATSTVAAEAAAGTGEIVVSAGTAAALPGEHVGAARGSGFVLRSPPFVHPTAVTPGLAVDADLLPAIPVALRDHLLAEQHEGEHRRATISFLRFSGIDRMLASDGPDATAAALDRLIRDVQEAVERHGVAFIGTDIDADGGKIVLTAGAPSSGGNDEEIMLLALRDVVAAAPPLPLRIGVNVGNVFAGDIGPAYRRTYTVMGDAVNLAARVMGRAADGQIVATRPVLTASSTTFACTDLPPFQVKGKRQPVHAAVVGPSLGRQDRADRGDLPLVGREEELAAFDEVLNEAAVAGTGRLVEVTGEAGIGKSRLLRAFRERAATATVHALECELHRATTPYGALRKLLRALLDIPNDAPEQEVARRLVDALTADLPELLEWAPLLAIAFGTEVPATRTTASLDERHVRPRLHEALLALLAWRWHGPVLVTIEDAQWMDEASADAVHAVAARLGDQPWVVVTARRTADQDLPEQVPVLRLGLEALDDDSTRALARVATDAAPLSTHDAVELIRRSGGNPLFLQELVAAAREAGGVDALPDSVGSLVTARIDRLPPGERALLREVSVLGQSFPRDLAAAVLTSGDASALAGLTDFLDDDGDTTRFRHAIIREVAYEGLPYRRRQALHAVAGDTIARTGRDQVELLSYHYHRAGRFDDAWRASCTAGDRAAAVYANVDAARFYERALSVARRLPELAPGEVAAVSEALGDALQRLGDAAKAEDAYRSAAKVLRDDAVAWARLQLKQARVKAHLRRYSQALATITRALRHLEPLGGDDTVRTQRAQLLAWYAHFRLDQGHHADAISWSRLAVAEAQASGDHESLGHAYRLLDWAHLEAGQPELAVYSQQAIELYEQLGDLPNLATVHNNLGGIAYWLGNWDDALEHYSRANHLDERTGDVLGAALGRNNIAEILSDQGRWEDAERLFRDADRVLRAASFRSAIAYVRSNLGRVLGRLGRIDEAHGMLMEARDGALEVGAGTQVVEADARLAELHVLAGRPSDALALIEDALRRSDTAEGIAAQAPLIHRVRGLALHQQGQPTAAREALEESLRLAAARGADYEQAVTEQALGELLEGIDDAQATELLTSSQATLQRLGVERLPRIPVAPAVTTDQRPS